METNNKTVEQACEVLYAYPKAEVCDGSGLTVLNNDKIAERILATHKREIADFQRRYDECVRKYNEADLERVRLRDEVAAKDAEIKRLTNIINAECNKCADCAKFGVDCSAGDVDGNEDCRACEKFISKEMAAKDADISSLRALVKELADMLEKAENKFGTFRGEYQRKYIQRKCRAVVEKAREALK